MSNEIDISVIIPCYNHGKYLEECVGSIISNTTNKKYEIIIVDDCSTDGSAKKAQELAEMVEGKFFQTKVNSKPAFVRNLGISNSCGRFITCIDGDDAIPQNYLQQCCGNLIDEDVDVCYSDTQCFGIIDKRYHWPPFNKITLRKENFIHSASMFRKEMWNKLNGFDEKMVDGWEDYDFWLRACKEGFRFVKVWDTFLYWRRKEKSRDVLARKKLKKLRNFMRRKHKDFFIG